jgi:hypothetical protein
MKRRLKHLIIIINEIKLECEPVDSLEQAA